MPKQSQTSKAKRRIQGFKRYKVYNEKTERFTYSNLYSVSHDGKIQRSDRKYDVNGRRINEYAHA